MPLTRFPKAGVESLLCVVDTPLVRIGHTSTGSSNNYTKSCMAILHLICSLKWLGYVFSAFLLREHLDYQSSSLVLPQTFIPLSVDTSLIVSKNHCSLVASHFFSFPGFNGARHRQISLSLFSQQSRGVVLVK